MRSVYEILSTKEFKNAKPGIPERDLLIATLDRAVLDYYSTNEELKSLAKEWLFDDINNSCIFSFNWICDHLGVEQHAVRERVKHLNIPTQVSQAHRWLRSKVQSRDNHQISDFSSGGPQRVNYAA